MGCDLTARIVAYISVYRYIFLVLSVDGIELRTSWSAFGHLRGVYGHCLGMSVNVRSGNKAFDSRARLCLAVETDRTPLKLAMDALITLDGNFCEVTDEQRDLRCLRYRMSVIWERRRRG